MRKSKRTPVAVEGGQALERFIRAAGRSIPVWCDEHGLTRQRVQIQRLINGEQAKRVSVNLAFAIEDATGGKVPASLFRTEPAHTKRRAA